MSQIIRGTGAFVLCLAWAALGPAACRDGEGDGDADSDVDGDADGDWDGDAESDADGCPPEGLLYGGACDPMTQTCCADGEKCTVIEVEAGVFRETCIPLVGSGLTGDLCAEGGEDVCGLGTTCVDMGFVSVCAAFCTYRDECPSEPPYSCRENTTGEGGYMVCAPASEACNPVEMTDCPEGFACVIANIDFDFWNTVCMRAGTHEVGDACEDRQGCVEGAGCYETETGFNCYRYCVLGESCPDDSECFDFGALTYGVCL